MDRELQTRSENTELAILSVAIRVPYIQSSHRRFTKASQPSSQVAMGSGSQGSPIYLQRLGAYGFNRYTPSAYLTALNARRKSIKTLGSS